MNQQKSRRNFLKKSMAVAAGTLILPYGCKKKNPNELITIGMIGTGSHGVSWNLKQLLELPDLCKVVAVCDVSMRRANNARDIVNKAYDTKDCKVFQDFRELLEDESIDAVQISTPDHWHVPISIMAALKGKHICCEKPTLTIDEGRLLSNVIKKTGVVYQVSLEDRFVPLYHQIAEIASRGFLGDLKNIKIELPDNTLPTKRLEITNPPDDLDYDLWLGPAKEIPYIYQRTFFNFRWNDAFSGGILTDWGSHFCDTALQAIGNNGQEPMEVSSAGETLFYNDGIFNTAYQFNLQYRYSNDLAVHVKTGGASIRVEGDKGWVESKKWRGKLVASNDKILKLAQRKIDLPTAKNEHVNFLESIIENKQTVYHVEQGQRLCSFLHCGNIALKLNRKVLWNPEDETFINDQEANKFKKREMREKWGYDKICPGYK